jgi:hypothetical protein
MITTARPIRLCAERLDQRLHRRRPTADHHHLLDLDHSGDGTDVAKRLWPGAHDAQPVHRSPHVAGIARAAQIQQTIIHDGLCP